MAAWKKQQEKAEKEKIINELLAPAPITGDDVKEYAGHLAEKSANSKSEA
jgi:hypothetical protein